MMKMVCGSAVRMLVNLIRRCINTFLSSILTGVRYVQKPSSNFMKHTQRGINRSDRQRLHQKASPVLLLNSVPAPPPSPLSGSLLPDMYNPRLAKL